MVKLYLPTEKHKLLLHRAHCEGFSKTSIQPAFASEESQAHGQCYPENSAEICDLTEIEKNLPQVQPVSFPWLSRTYNQNHK